MACDEIAIATDDDPTGEGELLAWEILDHLNLHNKKISRFHFLDETEKSLQEAFTNRTPITSMMDDPDYLKAEYRSRFDLLSMQWTRAASHIATNSLGNFMVLRQGRLKSAMVRLVGDQLAAHNNYQKIPYYQNRYKDNHGIEYVNKNEPHHKNKNDVPSMYGPSTVTHDKTVTKTTPPPRLYDLAALSAKLSGQGIKAQKVLEVYQKMYEKKIVSYPRTEDKTITPEQFDELLPLVANIASVVGVNPALLTHTEPRKTHVKPEGAHGANRPGPNVPDSLASLDQQFGKDGTIAVKIYEVVAKNYLAMLAEDYTYNQHTGHITDHPDFKGSLNVPVSQGYRLIFNDTEDDKDDHAGVTSLGDTAEPFIHEGFPPKPAHPTMKWLVTQLEKHDVGTGATRTSTYSDVTNTKTKYPLLKDTRGRITMTPYGEISYQLLPGTIIGDLKLTEEVYNRMRNIAKKTTNWDNELQDVADWVTQDIQQMKTNAVGLKQKLGNITLDNNNTITERYEGIWNGEEVSFKRVWGGHTFTDEECEQLLAGNTISFEGTTKDGNTYPVTGKLARQEYNGHQYVGFLKEQTMNPDRYSGQWNGQQVSFKRVWSGHTFTDQECEQLLAGEMISFEATSKAGNKYQAQGKLARQEFNGNPFVGFKPEFGGIPAVFLKHKFTPQEREQLEAGNTIYVDGLVSKKGNEFGANVSYNKSTKRMDLSFD